MFSRKKKPAAEKKVKFEVNPDLENERKKCTFNTLELTYFLDGGVENYKIRKEKENYFLSDPELQEKIPSELLSHEEQYNECLRKSKIVLEKIQKLRKKNEDEGNTYRNHLGIAVGTAIFKDGNPVSLHHVMFIPTLIGQASPEQKEIWLKKALDLKILGTYAQTELGHGTFIRGLETTATYIPETEQFELNSPTLSSYKWWPGGLGHSANYAVVVAQLFIKGKRHGIHPFIVQLRDEKTHYPMPGVKLGDIGKKLGMNATNNGFLALNKVRIPRNQMLMKNSQVLPDGTYVKSGNNKLVYGSMIYVRVVIVDDMSFYLGKAVTIATRYSAVRRQSEMKPGEREPQILDYQTQLYKLLPYLAFTYAFRFSAAWLWKIYNKVTENIDQGHLEQLPELHAMACCLKAVCTADAAKGVETVRMACGGHGYMTCSNLPTTYGLVTAANTYEGENTVMLLQTARALMKAWAGAKAGEPLTPTLSYLTDCLENHTPWSDDLETYVLGFKQAAAAKVNQCGELLQKANLSGMAPEQAWNSVTVQLVGAAEAHCRAFLVERYVEAVRTGMNALSPELRTVMLQLCELYCLFWVLQRTGDFLLFTSMRNCDVARIEERQAELLFQLRPNAVGLVDSFDFRDEVLGGSALGAWDGRVYERLLESAMQSTLNAKPVPKSFQTSIAPLMKAKY